MFIHCQFTVGQAPNDPAPTMVVFILGDNDPAQPAVVDLIKDVLQTKLGGSVEAVAQSSIGFHPLIHDEDVRVGM